MKANLSYRRTRGTTFSVLTLCVGSLLSVAPVKAKPALPQKADASAVAWLYMPQVHTTLQKANKPWNALLRAGFPAEIVARLSSTRDSELLLVASGDALSRKPQGAGWLRVPGGGKALAPELLRAMRQWGYREVSRADGLIELQRIQTPFFVHQAAAEVGFATEARLLQAAPQQHLGQHPHLKAALGGQTADVVGYVNIPKIYGEIARMRNGREIAGRLTRLGLADADKMAVTARLGPAAQWQLQGKFGPVNTDELFWQAFFDVDGVRPTWQVPGHPSVSSYAEIQMRPAKLYELLSRLYAFEAPLKFTLVQSQIFDVQRRLGKNLPYDVLGELPATWKLLSVGQGTQAETTLVGSIRDGQGLAEFLEPMGQILSSLIPALSIQKESSNGRTVFRIRKQGREVGVVGIHGNEVRFTVSDAALQQAATILAAGQRSQASATAALPSGAVTGWGWAKDGTALAQGPMAKMLAGFGNWQPVVKTLGPSYWVLRGEQRHIQFESYSWPK